ncbi:HAD family hydrolase [Metabacillus sp. HB246100]
MNWLQDIKAIIFDLDGTMYQHETFHKSYLRYVVEGTKWEEDYDFLLDGMENMLTNQADFKMGHYYLHESKIVRTKEDVLAFLGVADLPLGDSRQYIYGGDVWSIMNILTNRMDIPEAKRRLAFNKVRGEMVVGADGIMMSERLLKAISRLDFLKRRVLMTNTHSQSGHEFIQALNISSLFDEIYLDSKKPVGIKEVIKSLLVREDLKPHEILSIGDHPWNDLLPAKKLGCRTILISPYDLVGKENWDFAVSTSDEMAEVLEKRVQPTLVKN